MFSVIVPLYNKAHYIKRCLDSVVNQTLIDFEIIVVNDGSTDGGDELVSKYIERHPERRIRLINQPNSGPGAARNRGVRVANNQYVAFLDADDTWLPEYLFIVSRTFVNFPDAVAVTVNYVEHPPKEGLNALWLKRGISEGLQHVTPQTKAVDLVHMLAYMTPSTTAARKETITKWNGFAEKQARYGEDATLFLKILLNEAVVFSFKPLVQIDRSASSLSTRNKLRAIEPFVADPIDIVQACPISLTTVLRQFCAIRAFKTAAILGLWGEWRLAAKLVRRFGRAEDWCLPYFCYALLGCTPVARLAWYPIIGWKQVLRRKRT